MRFVSLFAGIGGFDLGLEQAGHECIGQVELDKNCRQVLAKHWPDVPRHDDVRTANGWADRLGLVGRVDLVCGGFPCQDLSVAGKRAGLAGHRSGLFWDALAFTTHVQAKWLILENVPGLLTSNQGRDFAVLISALADAGLSHIEWRVLDSQHFGVPQRRRRIFIVASAGNASGRPILVEREGSRWHPATRRTSRAETSRAVATGTREIVNALTANGLGGGGPDDNLAQAGHIIPAKWWFVKSRRAQSATDDESWIAGGITPTLNAFDKGDVRATVTVVDDALAVRRLTPLECERLQGFPDEWTVGQADTHRYTQMGNAVTVSVTNYIGTLLHAV